MTGMDEKHSSYSLKAPGASSAPRHLPPRGSFPRVDDPLVSPEISRDEIINGRRVVAFPAEAPHAIWHGDLQYVLRVHVVPGFSGAVDPLTRQGEKSDFASDACIFKDGIDLVTGTRHLDDFASVQEEHWSDSGLRGHFGLARECGNP
jgi:hypothetical protein